MQLTLGGLCEDEIVGPFRCGRGWQGQNEAGLEMFW